MTRAVNELRERLLKKAEEQDEVSVGDIVDEINSRGRGPFFLVPALIELTPIGSIPGVPTAIALTLAAFAVQVVIGRETMWLPGFLKKRSISSDKMKAALAKLEKIANWLDDHFHDRWSALVSEPFQRAAALVVLCLCATVPFLELVPFASSIPMLAIAAIGLAMLVHDGRIMALAAATLLIGAAAGGWWWLQR